MPLSSSGLHAKSLQSCPTLWDPMDRSLPGSSGYRILQARILEWVAMPSSRGSFRPSDWTHISCIAGGLFTDWATREAWCSTVGVERLLRKLRLERLASTAFLSTGVSCSESASSSLHTSAAPAREAWLLVNNLSLISFTPHLLSHPEQKKCGPGFLLQLHLCGMWADVWIRMTKGESGFMNFRLWTQGREWVRPPHSWNTFRRLSDFRQWEPEAELSGPPWEASHAEERQGGPWAPGSCMPCCVGLKAAARQTPDYQGPLCLCPGYMLSLECLRPVPHPPVFWGAEALSPPWAAPAGSRGSVPGLHRALCGLLSPPNPGLLEKPAGLHLTQYTPCTDWSW